MAKAKTKKDDFTTFEWSAASKKEIKKIFAKYPKGREKSATLPLLWVAQYQCGGWLPHAALDAVAETVGIPYIRVYEVATFYTMYNLEPVGEHFVQLCQTTPCWLRGSDDIEKVCHDKIGPEKAVSKDGKFSWLKVECLGACVNAPVVQINDDYYEDLDAENFEAVLDKLANDEKPSIGTQIDRQYSAPEGKVTSLTTVTQPTQSVTKKKPAAKKATAKKAKAATTKTKTVKKTTKKPAKKAAKKKK